MARDSEAKRKIGGSVTLDRVAVGESRGGWDMPASPERAAERAERIRRLKTAIDAGKYRIRPERLAHSLAAGLFAGLSSYEDGGTRPN